MRFPEDSAISNTPLPPYYAVIFTSLKSSIEKEYDETAEQMVTLAKQQPGFLGYESAREHIGITCSYWRNTEDILNWKKNTEHLLAQQKGKFHWYSAYKIRICKVERDYDFVNGKL